METHTKKKALFRVKALLPKVYKVGERSTGLVSLELLLPQDREQPKKSPMGPSNSLVNSLSRTSPESCSQCYLLLSQLHSFVFAFHIGGRLEGLLSGPQGKMPSGLTQNSGFLGTAIISSRGRTKIS